MQARNAESGTIVDTTTEPDALTFCPWRQPIVVHLGKSSYMAGEQWDPNRPATPHQRRTIALILLGVAAVGIAVAVIIAATTGHVYLGIAALIAWGIAMMVLGNLFALGWKASPGRRSSEGR